MKNRSRRKMTPEQRLNYKVATESAFDGKEAHKFYLDQAGLMENFKPVSEAEHMRWQFMTWLAEKGYRILNLKFRSPTYVPEETQKLYKEFLEDYNKEITPPLSDDHEKE